MSEHYVVEVIFGDEEPTRVYREPRTFRERILAVFGRRPFEVRYVRKSVTAAPGLVGVSRRIVVVEDGSEIRTPEQARALADAILEDLTSGPREGSEPKA